MRLSRYRWLDIIPAVMVTAGIVVLSLWENPQVPKTIAASDKVMHGLMYVLLAMAWMVPVVRRFPARVMPYMWIWAGVTAFGALMEVLQHFCTLTRSGEIADIYADAIGALIGLIIIAIYAMTSPKSKIKNLKS